MDCFAARILLLVATVTFFSGCTGTSPAIAAGTTKPAGLVGIAVTVVTPEGKPATGALAVLVPGGQWAKVNDGRSIDDDPTFQKSTANREGAVSFPGMASPFLLVVVHSSGYAQVDERMLSHQSQVRLEPWARVDGSFRVGDRPGAKEDIFASVFDDQRNDPEQPHAYAVSDVTTDAQGRFTIDRIPPGHIEVAHEVSFKFRGVPYAAGVAEQLDVDAMPGQTIQVSFGGTGRPIIGALKIPAELSNRKDWEFTYAAISSHVETPLPMPADVKNSPLPAQQTWYQHFIETDAGNAYLALQTKHISNIQRYLMDIAPDGTFRIEDVRAGSYSLSVEARAPGSDPSVKHGTIIATGDCKFVVPDIPGGRSEEALRLPDVALKVYRHVSVPSVGDTAPDIIAQTLDGKPLSLADFRGRFVLLEFSATWCNPCRGEIPDLKEMYNRYGKDGRLVIVSLSIDNMPYAPKQFANEFSLAWPQGFVGPDGNAVNDFGVDEYGVPSMWLIGPDGKILSRPMPGENTDQLWTKTAAAVAAVLGN